MKLNVWIIAALAPLTAVAVLAQDPASAPAPGAGATTNETAPTAPKKKSAIKKRVVLDPPMAATVKSANVNVRGQASFMGETVGHLQKGDAVTVLEQLTLSHPTKEEPAEWAQIALPAGIPVWVDGTYVDAETKAIKARRVNLRGGPGENYSLLGRLEKGAVVKEVKSAKGWIAIEAPKNAYAFVAAEFLEMQAAPALLAAAPAPATAPTPAPETVNVNSPAPPVAATTNEPVAPAPVAPPPVVQTTPQQNEADKEAEALRRAVAAEAAASTNTPGAPPVEVTPRVVTREGFVRRSYNLQAPTDYALYDIQNGTLTEFLKPKPGQNFKIYIGTRVTVTGTEGLDRRWPRSPVLEVQNVDLLP